MAGPTSQSSKMCVLLFAKLVTSPIHPFFLNIGLPVLFVLRTRAKIESTARCNIGMQEQPSFKTNEKLPNLAIFIVQTCKLHEKMQKN